MERLAIDTFASHRRDPTHRTFNSRLFRPIMIRDWIGGRVLKTARDNKINWQVVAGDGGTSQT